VNLLLAILGALGVLVGIAALFGIVAWLHRNDEYAGTID
jgi:hypothetical protein